MGTTSSVPVAAAGDKCTLNLQFDVSVAVGDVLRIAEQAGEAILRVYNGQTQDWQVETKADSSPLTRADKDSNTIICTELQKLSPHIPITSEESVETPWEIRKHYQYCWCVDPLDGTKEFIKRNDQFTVNIALLHDQEPVLGVVHVPCSKKTYFAVKGKGAFVSLDGVTKQIFCSEFSLQDEGLVLVGSSSHMNRETQAFLEIFKNPRLTQVGSSLKLVMVAEGAAHMYPRMAPCMEWDTAAADIIVREAGGVILQAGRIAGDGKLLEDWKDVLMQEKPLVYNKEDLLSPAFVVFGKRKEVGTEQAGK